MPCHSIPHYSHLHHNISLRFLTCEPNLKHEDDYLDEADIFYQNPMSWLEKEYSDHQVPSHLVMFSTLAPGVNEFLQNHGYRECRTFFHTHFPEGRVSSHVVVWCLETKLREQTEKNSVY